METSVANAEVRVYEVAVQLTNPNTMVEKVVVRTEYAYSIMDAVMQASMHITAHEPGSWEMKVIRVGPPAHLIRELTASVADTFLELIKTLRKQS
jgi:hypothetical protein